MIFIPALGYRPESVDHNKKEQQMTRSKRRPAQLAGVLALAIGAMAVFVLPGLAGAKGSHRGNETTGTITAFDSASRQLTIKLTGGESFTGTVDRRTKIRCEDQSGHGRGAKTFSRGESELGDDHGGHDDNGSGANCTSADLTIGAAVHEAELELKRGSAVWDEVEMVG